MKLLGLYAIRFLFYLLSKRVTNIVEILVVLDVIRLKFESGAREGGGGGGRGREGKREHSFSSAGEGWSREKKVLLHVD